MSAPAAGPAPPGAAAFAASLGQLAWRPMVLGGTPLAGSEWAQLPGDDGSWQAYWMRVAPGARSPEHVHPTCELVLVHDGCLIDMDGRPYSAGDTAIFAAGSVHWTASTEGCTALVVTRVNARVDAPARP